MLLYYKYRTDFGDTIVDSSPTSFGSLNGNEGELLIDFSIPETQPIYFWRVHQGNSIIPNTDENINNWENSTIPTNPDDSVPYSVFTGYTATTQISAGVTVNISYKYSNDISAPPNSKFFEFNNVNPAIATQIHLHYFNNNGVDVSTVLKSVNKGAKIYIQNLSNSDEAALYQLTADSIDNGTYVTFPISLITSGVSSTFTNNQEFGLLLNESSGVFVDIEKYNAYTGATDTRISGIEGDVVYLSGQTASKVSNTKFNSYTGTTAPNQFANKSAFLTFTGTTAPATYQTKSAFNTFTGSTLPNNYYNKTQINAYSASTLTNINSRLLTTNFNIYSGSTNTRIGTIETNYVSGGTSLGTGNAIFSDKTGRNLRFKSLVAGNNITLTPTSTGITISSTGGGSITANNGLTLIGSNVRLGGTLTGATTITSPATGSRLSFAGFPVQYATDVSANYNIRSFVDRGYVTGITSPINTRLTTVETNYVSGATNLGTGSTIFTTKTNRNLQLKTISGGNNIGVSGNTNQVVIYSNPEIFIKENLVAATRTNAALGDYDSTTVNVSGGNYKVTFSLIFGNGAANSSSTIELRRNGSNMFPVQLISRVSNTGERRSLELTKYITLPAGSQTFSIAYAMAAGITIYYSLIMIEKI